MKKQNISRNRSTLGITFYLTVSLPIISCVVILLSYNIDKLDIVLSTISSLVDYSGFKTDGGWHFRLLLLLPFISIAHYIGFTMLKEHETTFEIQLLKGVLIVFYTLVASLFFGSVGWVISVYLIKAFSYMHFYGNPIERLNEILNTYAYLKAYENLSNYLWANIVNFYIFCFVASLVHLILSKTLYPSKIEILFANYITEKAQRNNSFKSLQGTKEDIIDLEQSLKRLKSIIPIHTLKRIRLLLVKISKVDLLYI
ncbi:hypothetical protein [Francisella salimarina]|uniref:hypothetical protein n=1 Tax=Francisella salimarina TaxID=2599927 RepID=UPI003D8128C2